MLFLNIRKCFIITTVTYVTRPQVELMGVHRSAYSVSEVLSLINMNVCVGLLKRTMLCIILKYFSTFM